MIWIIIVIVLALLMYASKLTDDAIKDLKEIENGSTEK